MRSSLRNRIQKPSERYLEWTQSPDYWTVVCLWRHTGAQSGHLSRIQEGPGGRPGGTGRCACAGRWRALPLPGVCGAQVSKDSPCHLHVALPAVCPAGVPGGFSLTDMVLTPLSQLHCSLSCVETPSSSVSNRV